MPSDLDDLKALRSDFVVAKDEERSTEANEVIAATWTRGGELRGRAVVLPAGASEEERQRQLATLYASCKRFIDAEDASAQSAGLKEEVRK